MAIKPKMIPSNWHPTYGDILSYDTASVRNDSEASSPKASPSYAQYTYKRKAKKQKKQRARLSPYALLHVLSIFLTSWNYSVWKICSKGASSFLTELSIAFWQDCTFSWAESKRGQQNISNPDVISKENLKRYYGRDWRIVTTWFWTPSGFWVSFLY